MRKMIVVLVIGAVTFLVLASVVPEIAYSALPGEALFAQHCKVCHPDGGNIVNPKKTLHKKDRDANNVKTVADIIQRMRNPGPGMTEFDEKTIPDNQAKEIAKYILKTFK